MPKKADKIIEKICSYDDLLDLDLIIWNQYLRHCLLNLTDLYDSQGLTFYHNLINSKTYMF